MILCYVKSMQMPDSLYKNIKRFLNFLFSFERMHHRTIWSTYRAKGQNYREKN